MPKTKQMKKEVMENLKDKLQKANGVIVTEYQGLNVGDINDLRSKLRKVSCEYHIIQNTLLHLASQNSDYTAIDDTLKGPTAVCFVYGDPVAPAKVIMDFKKDHDKLKVKAGLIEKKVVNEKELKSLASLPSRQVLLSMLVSRMQAPVANLVYVLNAPLSKIVQVLDGISKKKAQAA
jgi:large subunit ribosomal protein L10